MSKAKEKRIKNYYLFSNGTEFMIWYNRNCCKCVKAVFYNEKKDFYPKYRCKIQEHIEFASISDGTGNKRDYEATHSIECPHKKTTQPQRNQYKKKDNSLNLFDE